ncbi:MAG: DUF1638 domain-containing protein [Phascolarctobacterium sp.]|nr:DUF1638 domain-containing protein [Phascolarctobacterium sp.]
MKSIILSCPTLRGELLAALDEHNADIPVHFMPYELHGDIKYLHEYVQKMIDSFGNVDRIYICTTGCGGGTIGLKATTAELVLPRTRDCLDILLSGDDLKRDDRRNLRGIYYTASWMDFSKNSEIDVEKLIAKRGQEEAEAFLRKLYNGFKDFYIIDTGCYDVEEVRNYLAPLMKILGTEIKELKGEYKILHKMVTHQVDQDFVIVPKGEAVQAGSFMPNK